MSSITTGPSASASKCPHNQSNSKTSSSRKKGGGLFSGGVGTAWQQYRHRNHSNGNHPSHLNDANTMKQHIEEGKQDEGRNSEDSHQIKVEEVDGHSDYSVTVTQ